jgi:general secretion pathway protein A
MYRAFFALSEKPFSITPDPRYLYLSPRHADALAHLLYGIKEAAGFIQLTGEVGTGKTTMVRSLLASAPKDAEIALIINPRLTPAEFLRTICEELQVAVPDTDAGSTKVLVDALNTHLLLTHAQGRRVVLIVDEAQNLTPEVLEQVRLLTNLETASQKLLQIILIGQPELRELLERNDLRQLAQRITARFHLEPLERHETASYVRHRLRTAGTAAEIFTPAALREVHRLSRGVPRLINVICDRALLGAYTAERTRVTPALVRRAASEVFDRTLFSPWLARSAGVLLLLLVAGGLFAFWRAAPWKHSAPPPPLAAPLIVPPPAPPTLGELLARNPDLGGDDSAFAGLLALWGAHSGGAADHCTEATQQGLACTEGHGTLAELHELNRPALLKLTDAAGALHEVLLTGIDAQHAQLRIGALPAEVSIADLSGYWFGEWLVLWKPTIQPIVQLHAGMRGRGVQQLRAQLDRWSGTMPAPDVSAEFDQDLVRQVETFQRAHHLVVDGIAGIETQMLLDAALPAPGSPLLTGSLPGRS